MSNDVVGLLSAKEIILTGLDDWQHYAEKPFWRLCIRTELKLTQKDIVFYNTANNLFLPNDLFVWRCLQYKKYKANYILYNEVLKQYEKNYYEDYLDWLFDFVMNGNMDKEYKEVKNGIH